LLVQKRAGIFGQVMEVKKSIPGIEKDPKYGIESAMSHKMKIFKAGIDF
jgi:hypothetical protein